MSGGLGFFKRKDKNHNKIRDQFLSHGYSVVDTDQLGKGAPDLIVAVDGFTFWFEIKSKYGKLSDVQKEFHSTWKGFVRVIRTFEQGEKLIKRWLKKHR